MALYTRKAGSVFNPLTAGGQPRGADMGEAKLWGTEVETAIDAVEGDVVAIGTQIDAVSTAIADEALARGAADSALGARITQTENDIAVIQDAQTALAIGFATWAELDAETGSNEGQIGEVAETDTGTHTDPVVGGTVDNAGRFRWSASPAGWERIGDALGGVVSDLNSGKVPAGDASRAMAIYADAVSQIALAYDGATGSQILTGDRLPNFGPLRVWIGAGQSVMACDNLAPQPAIDTVCRRPNRFLMFETCGLRGLGTTDITTLNLRKIVAAKEATAQTRASSFFGQLLAYEDTNRYATSTRLFFNCGYSGAAYSQIAKGQQPFTNMLEGVQYLVDLLGQGNVIVEGVIYDQGETNSADSAATFLGYLQTFYDDMNDAVTDGLRFITGQSSVIPLYLTQTPLRNDTSAGAGVLQAQVDAHVAAVASPSNRRIFLLGPRYNHWYGDHLHPLPYGQRVLGAEQGQAVAEMIYAGDHDPVYMTGATRPGGNVIEVATSASRDIAIDTSTYRACTNYGFVVTDSGGTPQTISSVAVSTTKVQITMSGSPSAGWIVRYAADNIMTSDLGPGGFGNIRDTRTTKMAMDGETPLYAWLCAGTQVVS